MNPGEIAQIITAIAALGGMIIGAISLAASLRNGERLRLADQKLELVHQLTNGMTKKLVDLTAVSSKAEGNLEGRAELKDEQRQP